MILLEMKNGVVSLVENDSGEVVLMKDYDCVSQQSDNYARDDKGNFFIESL